MTGVLTSQIELDGNGRKVRAQLAVPESGSGPGVVVLHSWWGLNSFFEQLCTRLAIEGYVTLAPDHNGGKIAQTVDDAQALMNEIDRRDRSDAILSAIKYLVSLPGVREGGVTLIGFSAGAAWSAYFSSYVSNDIKAVVLFYGSAPADFTKARASYQAHFAEHDEWEPDEDIDKMQAAMQAAGREVTLYRYPGTGHWFFEKDRPDAYNSQAANLAWERTLEFLRSH